jgi:hypothetical protein
MNNLQLPAESTSIPEWPTGMFAALPVFLVYPAASSSPRPVISSELPSRGVYLFGLGSARRSVGRGSITYTGISRGAPAVALLKRHTSHQLKKLPLSVISRYPRREYVRL